ncbi:MAG TPA: DUF362 domain-containing protein [Chloroflexi bacterium]|nr:DUF362 domain-containing protein [Chloroflexota bacterium]
MQTVQPHPRTLNVFVRDGKPLVARVPHLNGDYLPTSIRTALGLLGGLEKAIRPGDQVLLKPNFNCSYTLPLSTDLGFLRAAIEVLQDAGAQVTVGEMSGKTDGPTDTVVNNLCVLPMFERYGVPFVNFETDEWVRLAVDGEHWRSFRVPRSLYEADKRVYLANMRCHSSARFSAAIKLGVGWIDLEDRKYLHEDRSLVEAKVAELHLGWQPNLILVDGRRSTVSAYGRGEYVYPNVIMASGDMVALDTEVVKILRQFPEENRLDVPTEEMGQIKVAQAHGLGTMDYTLLQAPARTRTEEDARY